MEVYQEYPKEQAGPCACDRGEVRLLHKYDGKLFRRYTRNKSVKVLTECSFADDGTLVSFSQSSAESTIKSNHKVSTRFSLTISTTKTKHMVVTGRLAEESDREPIEVDGGLIDSVKQVPYLGSVIADSGRMDMDV